MHISPIVFLGLALLAYAFTQSAHRIKPARFPHLKGWQKLFGVLAVILAVLMIINPETFALGLLGDSAFFDLFVFVLSLQLQTVTGRAWHWVSAMFSRMMRVMIPRLSLSLSMFVLIFAPITDGIAAIQKAIHRMFS